MCSNRRVLSTRNPRPSPRHGERLREVELQCNMRRRRRHASQIRDPVWEHRRGNARGSRRHHADDVPAPPREYCCRVQRSIRTARVRASACAVGAGASSSLDRVVRSPWQCSIAPRAVRLFDGTAVRCCLPGRYASFAVGLHPWERPPTVQHSGIRGPTHTDHTPAARVEYAAGVWRCGAGMPPVEHDALASRAGAAAVPSRYSGRRRAA